MRELLGPGYPGQDADRKKILKQIPASRIPKHRLIKTDASTRFAMALGESYGFDRVEGLGHLACASPAATGSAAAQAE